MWQLLGLQPEALPLFASMKPPAMAGADWVLDGMPVLLDAQSRQQQRLLQAVSWSLPELLLRTALLCGEGVPLFAGMAATAATWTLSYWQAPGLEAATAAAKPQQLPGLLDCWLQCIQQQLLLQSPATGCPHACAAQSGNTSQQQQQQPRGVLLQVAATARLLPFGSTAAQQLFDAGLCSCDVRADPPGSFSLDKHSSSSGSSSSSSSSSSSNSSGSICSVRLQCDRLQAVGRLLECLAAAKVRKRGVAC
jgi:hypothetical protein